MPPGYRSSSTYDRMGECVGVESGESKKQRNAVNVESVGDIKSVGDYCHCSLNRKLPRFSSVMANLIAKYQVSPRVRRVRKGVRVEGEKDNNINIL